MILGGGIAGLAAAYELLKEGANVTVLESSSEVGGLARTLEKDGFRFDIGGHRFHSNNVSVVSWLQELVGEQLLSVPRQSHIFINNRFVKYPIQLPGALSIFSPFRAASMLISYLVSRITERNRPDVSFQDWVVKRYGYGLYKIFFEPYTEKVWGIPCNHLSAAWAEKRIGIPSMWRVIKSLIVKPKNAPATSISQFYYPENGFGTICEELKKSILEMGGVLHTSISLTSLTPLGFAKFRVAAQMPDNSQKTFDVNHVVSTIPLNSLLASIPQDFGSSDALNDYQLDYRDLICVFLAIDKPQVTTDSWTYFPLKSLTFGRTHEPKNWSSKMVPSQDKTSLVVEVFSSRGDRIWQLSDEEIATRVIEEISAIGWLSETEVSKSWVLRVPYAYPIYRVGYERKLAKVKNYLSQWPNLHLLGRTGSFEYMNSDGVIEDVFALLQRLFPEDEEFSSVNALAVQSGRWL